VKGQWDDQVKGWQIIGQWFHDRFTEAWNAVTGVFGNIGQFLMGIWDTEVKGWTNIGNWFHDRFTEAWNSVTNAFGGIGNWFHNTFTDVYNKIKNIIGNLGPDALKWAQDMINQFVQGIENGVAAVGKAVSKVADKIASFLHHSKPDVGPLADDDTWMPDFMNLLSKGIDDNIDKIKNSALNIATTVSTSVNPSSLPQGPSPTGGMIANEQALQYLAQLVQATQGIQRQQVTPPTSANIGAITQHFGFNVNGVNDLQSLINALNQSQGLQFEYGQRGATFNY
jgi:hypothetical protein